MKIQVLIASVLFSGSILFGQMVPGGAGPGGRGPGGPHGMHTGKVVTGAPYSATVTNTSVRTLADGNTIQRTTTGTVARDSQGRTYTQETITGMFGESGTKTVTFISDPVAGYFYTLNTDTKTAMRRALHTSSSTGDHAYGRGAGFGNDSKQATGSHAVSAAEKADLGTQVVNGVSAQGKSMTHTIPAGQMGNEKAIVSTTETWYSSDLQVVVSSKKADPREGTSTYALTNIQKAEPSSALFAVPSDYTMKDAPSFGGAR